MKRINDRQRAMLRCLAVEPRTAHSFTHGPASISPHIVMGYLDHMVAAGLIELAGKLYTITAAGREAIYEQPEPATGRHYCNASTTDPYRGPKWNIRDGGCDHEQFKSRGF